MSTPVKIFFDKKATLIHIEKNILKYLIKSYASFYSYKSMLHADSLFYIKLQILLFQAKSQLISIFRTTSTTDLYEHETLLFKKWRSALYQTI